MDVSLELIYPHDPMRLGNEILTIDAFYSTRWHRLWFVIYIRSK